MPGEGKQTMVTARLRAWKARRLVVRACDLMYRCGLAGGSEGNASHRIDSGRILVTPSGRHKGLLRQRDLVMVDSDGHPCSRGQPSSELLVHLAIYAVRPDVRAVLHAHPPSVLAASLASVPLDWGSLSEAVVLLGPVVRVPYLPPGGQELAQAVQHAARASNLLILERHGAVALGTSIEEALGRLEVLERCAYVLLHARFCEAAHLTSRLGEAGSSTAMLGVH